MSTLRNDTAAHFDSTAKEPEPKVLSLGWETIHHAVDALTYQLAPQHYKQIVAISRGGLIPGVMLSQKLGIPMSVVYAQSYEGTRRTLQKPTEIVGWEIQYEKYDTLVVDDIVDTGHTFSAISILSNKPKLCALVMKRAFPLTAHFITVDPSIWVKFPWEV